MNPTQTYSIETLWRLPEGVKWQRGALGYVTQRAAVRLAERMAREVDPAGMLAHRVIRDADRATIAEYPIIREPAHIAELLDAGA